MDRIYRDGSNGRHQVIKQQSSVAVVQLGPTTISSYPRPASSINRLDTTEMLTTRSMAGIFVAAVFGASVTVFASLGDFTRAIAVLFLLTLTLTGLTSRRPLSRTCGSGGVTNMVATIVVAGIPERTGFSGKNKPGHSGERRRRMGYLSHSSDGSECGYPYIASSPQSTLWLEYLQRGPIAALLVYCLVCLTSTLWSVFPAWTLYKSVEFSRYVILLAAVAATANSVEMWKKLLDWTWILSGALLFSVWLGISNITRAGIAFK